MPEKPEKFKIEFEIPEYKKRELKKLGRHFPDMATNLLLAVEVVKLRWSMQNRSYTQKEVYQVVALKDSSPQYPQ